MDSAVVSQRSSFRLFRTRLFAFAGTGMMSLASQGINSANNFISGVIMGRLCPKEEYGLYALGLSLVLLITDFQSTLISTPYMIYSPRLQNDDRRLYAGSTFIHQQALALITALVLLCGLAGVYFGLVSQSFARVLKILPFVIMFIMLKDFIRQMCYAALNVKAALLLDSTAALLQLGGLSLLVRSGTLSADGSFIVIGIACGLTSLGWLWASRTMFAVRLATVIPDLRQKWKLVKWLLASQLLWIAAMGLYPWLIAAFLGVHANGVWAACQGVIMIGNLICLAAQNLLGPKIVHILAGRGVSEMRRVVFRSALLMFSIMSVLCFLFVLFGDKLVVILYGSKYGGNGLTVALLAMSLAASAMTYPFSRGLFALERTDLDFMINLSVVMTLALGVWLVRTMGLPGAAIGLLAANSVSVLIRGVTFDRVVSGREQNRLSLSLAGE